MKPLIHCEKLTKVFKNTTALDELSFEIGENKIVGLIGRNGAGKTTLLKTFAGFIRPTSGEIAIWGEKPFDNLNVLSKLVFIDEGMLANSSLKLCEILELGKIYYSNWDKNFADRLIRHFGLNTGEKYIKLSTGMKTLFNIIMELSSRCPLTLLDEPTLGLDAAVRKEFYSILLRDYMENPRTFIISSHLLSEMENLLEEIVLIKEGALVLHRSMEDLQQYAVILNGKKELIEKYIEKKEVLHKEEFGGSTIAAVINNFTDAECKAIKENSVEISKLKVEDLCIYMTETEGRGGFEDVK